MTPIHNRPELLRVLDQAAKAVALLKIRDANGVVLSGTIQFVENGYLDRIIIESPDLQRYTKVFVSEIRQIDSDVLLELNDIVSQNFEVVAPVEMVI